MTSSPKKTIEIASGLGMRRSRRATIGWTPNAMKAAITKIADRPRNVRGEPKPQRRRARRRPRSSRRAARASLLTAACTAAAARSDSRGARRAPRASFSSVTINAIYGRPRLRASSSAAASSAAPTPRPPALGSTAMYATKPCGNERDFIGEFVEQQQKADALDPRRARSASRADCSSTISQRRSKAARAIASVAGRNGRDARHHAAPSERLHEGAVGRAPAALCSAIRTLERHERREPGSRSGSPARHCGHSASLVRAQRQIEQRMDRHCVAAAPKCDGTLAAHNDDSDADDSRAVPPHDVDDFANRKPGRHDVLDDERAIVRRQRKAAPQHRHAVFLLDEDRFDAELARDFVAEHDAADGAR